MAIEFAGNYIAYEYRIQELVNNTWIIVFPTTFSRDRVRQHYKFLLKTYQGKREFRLQRRPICAWSTIE